MLFSGRPRMKLLGYLLTPLSLVLTFAIAQNSPAQGNFESRTRVGQQIPAFTVTDTSGKQIRIQDLKGKVILVNFWATWCGPCRAEIPRLEKEVWQKHKSVNFFMVGIAREQSQDEIAKFRNQFGFTYPIAADPHREVYQLFADKGIPRTYIVGADGTILFQNVGYSPEEFDDLKKVVERELVKGSAAN